MHPSASRRKKPAAKSQPPKKPAPRKPPQKKPALKRPRPKKPRLKKPRLKKLCPKKAGAKKATPQNKCANLLLAFLAYTSVTLAPQSRSGRGRLLWTTTAPIATLLFYCPVLLSIIRSCLSVAMRAGPVFFHLISQNQTHWRHLSNAVVGHAGNPCCCQNLQPKGYRHNFCARPACARSNPPPDRPDGSTVCHNDFDQPLGLSAWRLWSVVRLVLSSRCSIRCGAMRC